MNVGNKYDTSVKTFPSSEAGLISFDGYFGYLLLACICYGAFTQTFDLVKRNMSDCRSSSNMSPPRLLDTDRHFFQNLSRTACAHDTHTHAHTHTHTRTHTHMGMSE